MRTMRYEGEKRKTRSMGRRVTAPARMLGRSAGRLLGARLAGSVCACTNMSECPPHFIGRVILDIDLPVTYIFEPKPLRLPLTLQPGFHDYKLLLKYIMIFVCRCYPLASCHQLVMKVEIRLERQYDAFLSNVVRSLVVCSWLRSTRRIVLCTWPP